MRRKIIQWASTLISNAYITGFSEGKIYKGKLKQFCVPGLNCYSCPGAISSCPIGSLQAVAGSAKFQISFYIIGILMLFGLVFGRFICGFLCPFGLFQELLYKIRSFKISTKKAFFWLKYAKYVVLVVFVIAMPLLMANKFGISSPAFCKYICPAGTLTAGLPLLYTNPFLRDALGYLFLLKISIAIVIVAACVVIYRFFCRYLCPLGAIYALFNKISLYRLECESDKCISCGACAKTCKMEVNPSVKPNDGECIRCGECTKSCKSNALKAGFILKSKI